MNLLCKPLSLNFVQKFEIHEKRGTPFWHDVIEDSMLSHLEPATTLATRILQKIEKTPRIPGKIWNYGIDF